MSIASAPRGSLEWRVVNGRFGGNTRLMIRQWEAHCLIRGSPGVTVLQVTAFHRERNERNKLQWYHQHFVSIELTVHSRQWFWGRELR